MLGRESPKETLQLYLLRTTRSLTSKILDFNLFLQLMYSSHILIEISIVKCEFDHIIPHLSIYANIYMDNITLELSATSSCSCPLCYLWSCTCHTFPIFFFFSLSVLFLSKFIVFLLSTQVVLHKRISFWRATLLIYFCKGEVNSFLMFIFKPT